VLVAAILTWVFATLTAGVTILLAALLLPFAATTFEAFGYEPSSVTRAVVEGAAVVVALSGTADLLAVFVLRRRRWARWTLLLLSVATGIASVAWAYYVVPLVVTGAAVAVVVLLLLPSTGRWFRGAATGP
jgi:hypothetical protein